MLQHYRKATRRALDWGRLPPARGAVRLIGLAGVGCALLACTGPEAVMFKKKYTADLGKVTVVGDEEATRFNQKMADEPDGTTSNSAIMRFYDKGKLQLFWLGGPGLHGTYEVTSATEEGLTASVKVADGRFTEGVATVAADGSAFDLEFGAPIVDFKEGSYSDCSTIYKGKPICTQTAEDLGLETRKVQLAFTGEAD